MTNFCKCFWWKLQKITGFFDTRQQNPVYLCHIYFWTCRNFFAKTPTARWWRCRQIGVWRFKLNLFLKVLIKLFQKFFGSRRRNAGRAPQSAKPSFRSEGTTAALASVKKKRKIGYAAPTRCKYLIFGLFFRPRKRWGWAKRYFCSRILAAHSPANPHPLPAVIRRITAYPIAPPEGLEEQPLIVCFVVWVKWFEITSNSDLLVTSPSGDNNRQKTGVTRFFAAAVAAKLRFIELSKLLLFF